MINSFIDTFINLDETKQNKLLNILYKFINPIKIYLILILLLLLIMCISNYYICNKLNKFLLIDKLT